MHKTIRSREAKPRIIAQYQGRIDEVIRESRRFVR